MSEKYIGTKFETIFCGDFQPDAKQKEGIKNLIQAGKEFKKMGLVDENGGNLSFRTKDGFIIKATGAHPYKLTMKDFSFVTHTKGKKVYVLGKKEPSSEARMHEYIYKKCPDIKYILHAHDKIALPFYKKKKGIGYVKDYPYGTDELAKATTKQIVNFNYIILKGHGVVAVGKTFQTTLQLISKYHEEFKKASK